LIHFYKRDTWFMDSTTVLQILKSTLDRLAEVYP